MTPGSCAQVFGGWTNALPMRCIHSHLPRSAAQQPKYQCLYVCRDPLATTGQSPPVSDCQWAMLTTALFSQLEELALLHSRPSCFSHREGATDNAFTQGASCNNHVTAMLSLVACCKHVVYRCLCDIHPPDACPDKLQW